MPTGIDRQTGMGRQTLRSLANNVLFLEMIAVKVAQ